MKLVCDTSIRVDDPVRSYDFPEYLDLLGVGGEKVRGCYVDGIVDDIKMIEGVMSYSIRVQASFYEGRPWVYDPPRTHVAVPVNGTIRHSNGYRKVVNCHVLRRS